CVRAKRIDREREREREAPVQPSYSPFFRYFSLSLSLSLPGHLSSCSHYVAPLFASSLCVRIPGLTARRKRKKEREREERLEVSCFFLCSKSAAKNYYSCV